MLRVTLMLAVTIGFAGCAHREDEAASDQDGNHLYVEEHPRPLLPEGAWNRLAHGMTKDEVAKLLGPPDETSGPVTITGPSEMIIDRDGKAEHIPLRPTTRVIGGSEWKYLRPTSESSQIIYTIDFEGEWVNHFWIEHVAATTKP